MALFVTLKPREEMTWNSTGQKSPSLYFPGDLVLLKGKAWRLDAVSVARSPVFTYFDSLQPP